MDEMVKIPKKEFQKMKRDIEFIKHILEEEYELSDETRKKLAEARNTPKKDYIKHDEMVKEFL